MAKKNKKTAKAAARAKKKAKSTQSKAIMASSPIAALSSGDTLPQTDSEIVQEAYEDSLKESMNGYFTNCIDVGPEKAEERFLNFLAISRKGRDRLIQLVK